MWCEYMYISVFLPVSSFVSVCDIYIYIYIIGKYRIDYLPLAVKGPISTLRQIGAHLIPFNLYHLYCWQTDNMDIISNHSSSKMYFGR